MSDQDIQIDKYSKLRSTYEYYIGLYNALYQLKTENEEELNSIYKMIKASLIDSKKFPPKKIIKDILYIIPYNIRYTESYLKLAKNIYDNYHITEVENVEYAPDQLFYKEYGIKLDKSTDYEKIKSENLNISSENPIYRSIMYNDKEKFISFTEIEGFDKNQELKSDLHPYLYRKCSLLELCCCYGAVDCFKFLRTKFNSEITQTCLQLSFIGGNQEIMSECLKYQKPNEYSMQYAIISHNIDFVTYLMNEYNMEIDFDYCGIYNNLESFLVYFDQTNDISKCFVHSSIFNIPSLCEYFLSVGANINETDEEGRTALHYAVRNNYEETTKFLISHGANINEKDSFGNTVLLYAAEFQYKEIAELLILNGANIKEKNRYGQSALCFTVAYNTKEIVELLISLGANINEKYEDGFTALCFATIYGNKETLELLISHGANINEKDNFGRTALHFAAENNRKDIVELLISHGANINEKDRYGRPALHFAAENNRKEIIELLISHGANINEKDNFGRTTLHFTEHYYRKEIMELFISHGANINEKDQYYSMRYLDI
ncbi:ankyrin repeat protein, putative [Trichomonas vaginalis G3]|uniref:Ankyrin repeat protein, putative n=1 Tax=Trichomonas vaginalis (strain ATCC PRA-98 / G3) TaxID=412133 RepID=A2DGP6_TRIV3|nr:ankyrin repeat and SOCS box-containing protein 4 family [Trichomonas vaginalis G3]EAY20433.1 ankyrin repeat protein, putative [Trichomonas vaginalis G3]KAI5490517.1 ankyrin repeat and SOCS box-containing protein 4 family [Trichomonas vaginalis G3]|eukprot:XP_001581419.1 ankyrin repeat protein [Trichomonas vaginalis G3]